MYPPSIYLPSLMLYPIPYTPYITVKVSMNAMASLAMFTSELNARMDDRRTSFQR